MQIQLQRRRPYWRLRWPLSAQSKLISGTHSWRLYQAPAAQPTAVRRARWY